MKPRTFLFTLPKPLPSLEEDIRKQLSESIQHIVEQVEVVQPFDRDLVTTLCQHMQDHRVNPSMFARYQDILSALSEKRYADIPALLQEMHDVALKTASFDIVRFSKDTLGDDVSKFTRIVFSREFGTAPIRDPGEEQFQTSRKELREALSLLKEIVPEAFREIHTLWSRVWVGESPMDPGVRNFAGVTSFLLWGGTFMNTNAQKGRIECADYLVHEVTHGLLFALSASAPLVLNHLEERYPSPLRQDPRPMDGIYHATLVCGRLLVFYKRALESTLLTDEERDLVLAKRPTVEASFRDGLKTVQEFGKLSDLGASYLHEVSSAVQNES